MSIMTKDLPRASSEEVLDYIIDNADVLTSSANARTLVRKRIEGIQRDLKRSRDLLSAILGDSHD